jgi:ribose transport system permease protein
MRQGNLNAWLREQRPLLIASGIIVALIVVTELRHPGFASVDNLRDQLRLASFLGVAAAAQTILILTGGIDLSVAWNLNFSAILMTQLAAGRNDAGSVVPAIAAALAAATGVGLLNGLGVAFLKIPPLVMTLGTNTALIGLTLVYTNGTPQGTAPRFIIQAVNGRILGIPWAVVVWLVVSLAVLFLLKRTIFGRHLYAIGNNARAAYLSGVPVRGVLVAAYTLAGFLAGITGFLLTGYSSQSYLRMGDPFVLPSIAAVVIGGTSILGGSGGYVGTILGAIIVRLLLSVLSIENRGQADQEILFGAVVLAMLLLYGRESKVQE